MLINAILILTVLLCLSPSVNSIAGDCDDKRVGAGTPTVSGNYIYPPGHACTQDPDLEYDTVNSAETVDRNGSAALVVIGNNAPFTWSVSGSGFSLENEGQPTGPTNTLYADDMACGAATITVTGCDGTIATGYVRCISGHWVQTYSCNASFCGAFCHIEGKYMTLESICYAGGPDDCQFCQAPCNDTPHHDYWLSLVPPGNYACWSTSTLIYEWECS